jgi:hypothetical protein
LKNITVRKYNSSDYQQWNTFISNAKNATFLFHRDFMEYHKDRFEDYSLIVESEGKWLCVVPANAAEDKIISHQGLTYGGLVYTEKLKLEKVILIFEKLLKYLNEQQFFSFKIKCLPSIYATHFSNEIDYALFLSKAQLIRRDALAVIDLTKQLVYSKDRKEGVKRGDKNKLEIREELNFEPFWNTILIPNLSRKHNAKPVHSLEEITMLKQKFPERIRQFSVYHNDEIVAGTTVFETDLVAHSQYISGNELKNEFGSLDFLHHYLFTTVYQNKKYFDFGISNENEGKNVNQGLSYWKESFGANSVTQDFYEVTTANYSLLNSVFI